MNSFDPAMISFFGRNERQQQIWEWENLAHPQSDSSQYCQFPSFLENAAIANTSFYDCSPSSFPLMATGSSTGSLYSMVPRKREEDWSGGGIGLNLGHRMYFPTGGALPVDRLFHRSAAIYQVSAHVPLCQVEGCKADLTMAKNYHRRHKVCEFHSKSAAVIIGGMHQRFCQQCSRFHILSEFDDAKRSCRKRLADHNRRRRKPRLPAPTSAATSNSAITQDSRSAIGTSSNLGKESNSMPQYFKGAGCDKKAICLTDVPAQSDGVDEGVSSASVRSCTTLPSSSVHKSTGAISSPLPPSTVAVSAPSQVMF